ncbi:alpha/beta fold hydrolase [Actinomadura sp. DC4]|uniref:thioesterase II family protein n=1 Tax=Actinomadura sp. DC4 TaxID=3055069 RepID=UPI0025B06404|nr:alpha/beta fold hydrolase [Actinomadura sp. DC4]MDN3356786.1 thioesterase domain-containing protein [Actinomadura sp. DC4]
MAPHLGGLTVAANGDAADWVRSVRAGSGEARRLVCFPHAGGGASFYRPFADGFPPDVDVRVVQYPGRETRAGEPLVGDMGTLADRTAEAVAPLVDRPTAFFGHSMGASVAYEVVRRLEAAGSRRPDLLFLSARQAPGGRRESRAHELGDEGFAAVLRTTGGTPSLLLDNPEMRDYLLPIIRNDYRLIETYRPAPGPRLRTGIVAIAAEADATVAPAEVDGWGAATSGGFARADFPGDHFYLLEQAPKLVAAILGHLRWDSSFGT